MEQRDRTERREWPDVPGDWPRQLGEADEEREAARAAPDAEARVEAEETARAEASKSGPGTPTRGKRTQTGRGSTSGWS